MSKMMMYVLGFSYISTENLTLCTAYEKILVFNENKNTVSITWKL
jgi:hypothetical protein